jgi:hypothetical protein
MRRSELHRKYGMTEDQYQCKLLEQNGACAVCKNPPSGRCLDVDHDHKNGRVRGLLCMSCNLALGKLRDDPILIEALLLYRRSYP